MRLIDADALLKNRFNMYTGFQGKVPVVAVRDVDEAPTIDPEELRPRGEWIERQEPISWCEDDVDVFYECSSCGLCAPGETNFCPNCGADMRWRKRDGGK